MTIFRSNALSWAVIAAGFTFIITPASAQTLKTRSTQTISIASNGFFDFDTDESGDRASADIRLVKGGKSDGALLEPLNGAGLGFLHSDKKLYQACAANMDDLKASRINLSSLAKATQICVRTSENRVAVFKLGDKGGASMDIDGYSVWQRPSTLPAPPADNPVFYGSQKNRDKPSPDVIAAEADALSLTFNVPVTISNVTDGVEGFRVSCSIYHPGASVAGVPSSRIWTRASSQTVSLKGAMRREHSEDLSLTSTFLSSFDLSAIEYYTCYIELKNRAAQYYYTPTPQNPPTWPQSDRWRVQRDGSAANQPYATVRQPIDAAALMTDNDGRIETARLAFNGLELALDIATRSPGSKGDDGEPNSPPPGQALLNTQEVTCPSRETVQADFLSQSMGALGWRGSVETWMPTLFFRDAWVDVTRRQVMCRYSVITEYDNYDDDFTYPQRAVDFNFEITSSGACENVTGYVDNQGGGLICSGNLVVQTGDSVFQGTEPTACVLRCPAPVAYP